VREVLSQVPEGERSVSIQLVGFRANVLDVGCNVDTIFPLEFGPHTSELRFVAVGGFDIVHDVDVDVAEHNAGFLGAHFPDNIAEDDP